MPPIHNQLAINKFVILQQIKLKPPPVYAAKMKNGNEDNNIENCIATVITNVSTASLMKQKASVLKDRKPIPYPRWTLVYNDFLRDYYYENNKIDALLFAQSEVDLNSLKIDVDIQIEQGECLAHKLKF